MDSVASFLSEGSLQVILIIIGFALILLANIEAVGPVKVRSNKVSFLGIFGILVILAGLVVYIYEENPYQETEILEKIDGNYKGIRGAKITEIFSYARYGNGDVFFRIDKNIEECPHGLWLSPEDPGFRSNLEMVSLAKATGATISAYGLPAHMWPGTSGRICRLYSIAVH